MMDGNRITSIFHILFKKWLNPTYLFSKVFINTVSVVDLDEVSSRYLKAEQYEVGEIKNYNVVPRMKCVTNSDMKTPEGRLYVLKKTRYITNYPDKTLLLDGNNNFIVESSNTMRSVTSFDWKHLRRVDKEVLDVAMPFRAVSNNYYHTVLDNAPRLYALYSDEAARYKNIEVLCVNEISEVEKYLFERLLPVNANVRVLEDKASYQIESCLFPTFVTSQYSGYVPKEILDFFEKKLLPERARCFDKYIYISRKKATVRRVVNEDEVVSVLKGYGFIEYCLEDLSFIQQIELFYDAVIVVGSHGAGFTNLVFSRDVAVLEMFPYKYVKPSYYYLTRCVGGIYDYTCSDGDLIGCDFSVDVNLMEVKIKAFLKTPKVN